MRCPRERQLTQCGVSRYTLQFIHPPHRANAPHQVSAPQEHARETQLGSIVYGIGLHVSLGVWCKRNLTELTPRREIIAGSIFFGVDDTRRQLQST